MPESRTKQAGRRPRAASTRAKTSAPSAGPAAEPAGAGRPDRGIELAIIGSVQDALASRLGMQAIYDLVGDRIREVFAADTTFIVYHDVVHHALFAPYYIDRGVRPATPAEWKHGRPYGKGLTETIIETGRPLLLRTVEEQEAHGAVHIASPGATRDLNRTFLGVPLFRDGRACGALSVQSYREHAYDENDARLLSALAGSMSVALENARLFDETQRLLKETEQRNAELAVINSIQQALGAELDFQAIVDVVGDKLREVFATGDIGIRWWDESTNVVSSLYEYEHGVRLHFPPAPPDPGDAVDRFLHERRVWVAGSRDEMAALGIRTVPGTDQSRSLVVVPMMAGARTFGFVLLENHDRDHAFGGAEVRLLETIVGSMGVALLNAKSYEAERQRAAELAIINAVQAGLASKLDMQAIYDLVGDKIREIFRAQAVGIGVIDPATGLLRIPYLVERGRRIDVPGTRVAAERGFAAHVRRTGRSLTINSGMAERMAELGEVTEQGETPKSALWVPLCVAGQPRGAITVQDLDREGAFGEADVRLLETLAASMSVALENARLFDETQRHAREASALSDVGRDLSSTLDLTIVMDRIAAHAKELLVAENSAIFVPEGSGARFRTIVALGEIADELKATAIEPGRGIIGTLLQSGRAEFVNDTAADPRAVRLAGTAQRRDERLMVVPLLAGTEVQGAMAVWRTGGSPFDSRDLEFLVGLSQQAVIALNNARLFDETRASLGRQTATAEVLQVISGSMADPKPVFDRILASAKELFDADVRGIYLVGDDGLVHVAAVLGEFKERIEALFPIPLEGSATELSIEQGRVMSFPDVVHGEGVPPGLRDVARRFEANYALAQAPLMWEGRGIGALNVARLDMRPFSEKECSLLETFANQAVIAIQNARLFNETKEALEQQTATAEVLRVISSSPTDTQPVFDAIVQSAARLFGRKAALRTVEPDGLRRRAKSYSADGEFHGAEVMPIDRESLVGRAVLECRALQVADTRAPDATPYARKNADRLAFRAAASAPLLRDGVAVGAISVSSPEPGAMSDKQMALLATFADQAVIAIENVRLFNETQEALAHQTASAEVLQVISSSVADATPVFEKILDSCERLIPSDGKAILVVDERATGARRRRPGRSHRAGRRVVCCAATPAPSIER